MLGATPIHTLFGAWIRVVGVVTSIDQPFFMFEALFCETMAEAPLRLRFAESLAADPRAKVETLAQKWSINLHNMSVYRWAQAILVLDVEHPLCPLFWQAFFSLFLARTTTTVATGAQVNRTYGPAFFRSRQREGWVNQLYEMARANAARFRSLVATDTAGSSSEDLQRFTVLTKMYGSFSLWLSEDRLRVGDFNLSSLPADFDVPRLVSVIFTDLYGADLGADSLWHDLVHPAVADWMAQRHAALRERSGAAHWLPRPPTTRSGSTPSGSTRQSNLLQSLAKMTRSEPLPSLQFQTPEPFQRVLHLDNLGDERLPVQILQDSMDLIVKASSDHVSRAATHVALDLEITESLPNLYVNDTVTRSLSKPCHKGQQCSGAAVFEFQVPQQRTVHQVEAKLGHTKDAVRDLLSGGSLPSAFCACVLLHKQVVTDLLELPAAAGPESVPFRAAVRLFFTFAERFNTECMQFAPANQLLAGVVPQLGERFIKGNRREINNLITVVLQHRHLFRVLVPLIQPDPRHGDFIALYRQAAETARAAGGECVSAVLRQFHFHDWLQVERSGSDRRRILQDLFSCCVSCFPVPPAGAVRQGLSVVMGVHDHNIMTVAGFRFPEHFIHTLMLLLDATKAQTTTPQVWTSFLSVVQKPRSAMRSLTPSLMSQAVDLIHRHLMETRGEGTNIYSTWALFVDPVLELYRTMADFLLTPNVSAVAAFDVLQHLYEPWLLPLPMGDDAGEPWHPYREEMVTASRFAAQLTAVCTKLPLEPVVYLPLLWELVFDRVYPVAPAHVLDVLHNSMLGLPWEKLVLTPGILDRQLEALVAGCAGAPAFCAFVLSRGDLAAAVASCGQGHGEASYVLNRLLQIMLTLAGLTTTTPELPEALPHFLDAVSMLPWEFLLLEDYTQRCESLLINATALHLFNEASETVRLR